jgi:hypothetical protein
VRVFAETLNTVIASGEGISLSLQVDQRSALRGLIIESLQFQDGSSLSFREFVDVSQTEPKLMYAYHYQSAEHHLIFRYDNAVHRPALPQSEHKHTLSGIAVSSAPTLPEGLDQILIQVLGGS